MERKIRTSKQTSGERVVKEIKRKTQKQYRAEEKIRIVLGGLKGEVSVAVVKVSMSIERCSDQRD